MYHTDNLDIQGSYIHFQVNGARLGDILSSEIHFQRLQDVLSDYITNFAAKSLNRMMLCHDSTFRLEGICKVSDAVHKPKPQLFYFGIGTSFQLNVAIIKSRWPKVRDPFKRFFYEFDTDTTISLAYNDELKKWQQCEVPVNPDQQLLKEGDEERRRDIILDNYDPKTILRYLSRILFKH